jgi:inner membrane protein
MMTKTHVALAVAGTSFVMGTAEPVLLYTAGFASLLPDLDTSSSLLGRVCYPLSRFIEDRFPHRTLTHSFLATIALAAMAWPLRWVGQGTGQLIWRALVFGYFFGWIGDVFTKSGAAAFYPATMARLVIPRNPRLRLSTGTRGEYAIFALLVCLLIVSAHINTEGGLMRAFATLMGQPESAMTLFQKEGARRQITATIEGRNVASNQRVVMEGEIIELEGNSLLVREAKTGTLYLAGSPQMCPQCQIHVDKVRARAGKNIETRRRSVFRIKNCVRSSARFAHLTARA